MEINAEQVLAVGEPIILGLIKWIRSRHAATGKIPTQAEALAHFKGNLDTYKDTVDVFLRKNA